MVQGNPTVQERSLSVTFPVCDRSIGRFDGARESTQGRPSSCPSTCFGASSGGACGIVQAFLGTCQEAQAVVDRAREQKALHEAEVAEGEARYAKLLAEAATVDAPPVVAGDRTSGTDQRVGVGTRRVACSPIDPLNPKGSSRYMDGRPSPCRGHPTHAHFRHARSRRLDEPTQLRASQCDGVRGSSSRGQDWQFGGTRGKCVFHNSSRRVNGGGGQVVVDVESDRRGRRETSVCDRRQCKWSEAVMRESRYGFRGVRVGEASNPSPPTTRSRARGGGG